MIFFIFHFDQIHNCCCVASFFCLLSENKNVSYTHSLYISINQTVHRVDGAEMASPLPSSFPHFPLKQGIVVLAVNKNGHLIYIPHIQWFNYCFLDEKSLFSFSLCNWNWMDGAVQRYIKFHTQASFSFPSTSFI